MECMMIVIHGMSAGSEFKCLTCGLIQKRRRHLQKYCNNSCQMHYEYASGERNKRTIANKAHQVVKARYVEKFRMNPTFKISKRGYRMIYVPERGWVKEHHYVWEQHNNAVPKGMVIHHKNSDKLDNRMENLVLMIPKEHHQLHYAKRIIDKLGRFT